MKVTTNQDGLRFTLDVETEADQQLVDALDFYRQLDAVTPIRVDGAVVQARAAKVQRWRNAGCFVQFHPRSAPGLSVTDPLGEALRRLRDLLCLCAGQTARHGHVGTLAADPQTKKSLAAVLEQVEMVAQVLRTEIGQGELVGQEVGGAHDDSSVVAGGIVPSSGQKTEKRGDA